LTIAPLNIVGTHVISPDTRRAHPGLSDGPPEADRALILGGPAEVFYPTLTVAGGRRG
jgi:hypothetical protein